MTLKHVNSSVNVLKSQQTNPDLAKRHAHVA